MPFTRQLFRETFPLTLQQKITQEKTNKQRILRTLRPTDAVPSVTCLKINLGHLWNAAFYGKERTAFLQNSTGTV
jgi:hypothetical protein